MAKPILTAARLRELLHYNPETGIFTWIAPRRGAVLGAQAGGNCRGYITVSVDMRRYGAHRLAWLYMTGEWPENRIDHRDGNPGNNIFTNLRDVPALLNSQNFRAAMKNSKSQLLGTHQMPNGRWAAQIRILGRKTHLGLHDSAELAHLAYIEAKRIHHQGNTL